MGKIRINELARELEVKAKAVIDYLAELGIEDKKSHSSSIEGELIDRVKAHFREEREAEKLAATAAPEPAPEGVSEVAVETKPSPAVESKPAPSSEVVRETRQATLSQGAPTFGAGQRSAVGGSTGVPSAFRGAGVEAGIPSAVRGSGVAPAPPVSAQGAPVTVVGAASAAKSAATEPGTVVAGRRPGPGEVASALRGRIPLRPPVRSHGEPKTVLPPPGRPILEPIEPVVLASPPVAPLPLPPTVAGPAPMMPGAAEKMAAAGSAVAPPVRSVAPAGRVPSRPLPPLGPARPGEPIYTRRPVRPGGRPFRPAGGSVAPAEGIAPAEPSRRGMHPVRGRAFGGPARGERGRHPQPVRERPLRIIPPPKPAPGPIRIDREITISEGITVKDLSEKLGVKARDLIRRLLDLGVLATINQNLDPGLAEQVAKSFGAQTTVVTFEEEAVQQLATQESQDGLVSRAPVVTVMGHVDHGKTSLLDAIRETNVTAHEAGGITQHIGAYTVTARERNIVFLDTPGHEAFTRMRARGSKVTDIVVLVVAAEDGVMPQTLEAIDHARAAKVPILVAINKIDKPGALPERVKKQLADRGLVPEDWGGDTVTVEVSAKQKTNLDLLLEMILLVADLQDLKANPKRPASGTVLEARLDKTRGPVATLLVQNGTLRVGDSLLVGAVFGKIRAMLDDRGGPIEEAPPSTPVEILGLQTLPQAGDQVQAVSDLMKAKQIALYREGKLREISLARSSRLTLEQLHDQMKAGAIKELPIILKADVQGSAEVLAESLAKLGDERVKTKVIHSGVGAINISDVLLASASNSIIIGFNVRPERKAAELAQQEKVDIRLHSVIYNVTDEVKKAMVGLLEPTHREVVLGKAEVLQTFRVAKVGTVAGAQVSEGRLTRDSSVRLLRDNVVIHEGRISSLRRFKDDVSEVKNGYECGIALENYNDVKVGDVIEAFTMEKVAAEALA